MSILGIGLDLVELARVARLLERHGERFAQRLCVPGELQERRAERLVQHLGGLFAAKEAVLKALGTGWAQGLGFRDVEVVRGVGGAPGILLHGAAALRAERLGVSRVHLSITHERDYAAAVAVLEGPGPGATRHAREPLR
jgi:holo-[acyl-carrier protein] synthase